MSWEGLLPHRIIQNLLRVACAPATVLLESFPLDPRALSCPFCVASIACVPHVVSVYLLVFLVPFCSVRQLAYLS